MSYENSIQSMTGFGSKEAKILPFGTICVELRSINHKAADIIIHLPEGFLSLEDRIKKEIETRIKRGRVTCSVLVLGGQHKRVFINRELLRDYIAALKNIRGAFHILDEIRLDTLVHLPGVVSLIENRTYARQLWPRLKTLMRLAIDELVAARQKEGSALNNFLKTTAQGIQSNLGAVKARFKKAVHTKLSKIKIDEERASFLKETDITEEIERLEFHAKSFKHRLRKQGPMGKELDFIAQEMQREANTMAAKSFDMVISSRVIQIKSQIEKIREQLQNVE